MLTVFCDACKGTGLDMDHPVRIGFWGLSTQRIAYCDECPICRGAGKVPIDRVNDYQGA